MFFIGSALVLGLTHHQVRGSECGLANDAPHVHKRVVGGKEVGYAKYPWFARLKSIDHDHNYITTVCGGSLITSRHVLTAAHCFGGLPADFPKETFFKVWLGLHNTCVWSPSKMFTTTKAVVHEKYDHDASHGYDIALLTLNESVDTMPVCLPPKGSPIEYESEATIAGFGLTHFGDPSPPCEMNEATLEIFTNAGCMKTDTPKLASAHEILDKNLAFCAGVLKGGISACMGDSGGPILVQKEERHVQKGIISYIRNGIGPETACGAENELSIYTNVASFIDWINAGTEAPL